MSRKKRKKKFKQKKIDYKSLSREEMKSELIKILNNINIAAPSQKQIDFVVKKIQKIKYGTEDILLELMQGEDIRDRDRATIVLMELELEKDTEKKLEDLMEKEDTEFEVRLAVLCIFTAKSKITGADKFPEDIKELLTSEEKLGLSVLEKKVDDLTLMKKFLLIHYILNTREQIYSDLLNIFSCSTIAKLRWELAFRIVSIVDKKVISPLLKLREDKDSDVRIMAKKAISFLRDKGINFFEQPKESPLHCCYITEDIRKNGLGTILIARKFKDNYINYAFFLIDVWGMGLKDVFGERKCHKLRFDKEVIPRFMSNPYGKVVQEDIKKAKKFIFGGVDFARNNGFKVPKEFLKWKDLVGSIKEEDKDFKELFGKNNEILVMASPEDIMKRINWNNTKEEYYDDKKISRPDYTFEEALKKMEERNIKFITSLDSNISDELFDILSEEENKKTGEVNQKSEEVAQKTEEVVQKTEEVDQKTEEVDQKTEEVDPKPDEVAPKPDEVAKKIDEVAKKIDEASQKPQKANQKHEEVAQKTDEVRQKPEEVAAKHVETSRKHMETGRKPAETNRTGRKPVETGRRPGEENRRFSEDKKRLQEDKRKRFRDTRDIRNKKTEYRKYDYNKKPFGEDFDLTMENMYDDLEEYIFEEEYQKAYSQLERMLKRASRTSWEEDVLKDLLSFCLDNVDYHYRYLPNSERLESFYKKKDEKELIKMTLIDRADFLGFTGKTEEGLELYQTLLNESPDFYAGELRLANFYLDNNMLDKAVKTYKELIGKSDIIDEDTLADALLEFIYIIEDYGLEGEEADRYRNIAEQNGIYLCEEPEVLVKAGGNDYQI